MIKEGLAGLLLGLSFLRCEPEEVVQYELPVERRVVGFRLDQHPITFDKVITVGYDTDLNGVADLYEVYLVGGSSDWWELSRVPIVSGADYDEDGLIDKNDINLGGGLNGF